MKIETKDGSWTLVDEEDVKWIEKLYLYESHLGYIMTNYNGKITGLHRIIMNCPDGLEVDHIDNNRKNNQKANLRICTRKENAANRLPNKKGTSKYKGVFWDKDYKKWRTSLSLNGTREYINSFTSEIAAANCYNYHAKLEFGEFARLNDVPYMPKEEWEKFKTGTNKTSAYRGVSKVKDKWLAQIWDGKRNIRIGDFDTEIDAAKAYNEKALEIRGDKARLNDI